MKSLNQIIAELETFANVHYQIHTFGHGDVWEIAPNSSSIVYPILWLVPQGATTGLREVTTNFTVLCMDLVRSGEENETEVLSDTLQILLDVISYYRQQHDQNYIIEFGSNIQPFTERDPDMLAGHSITVSIRQPFNYSECAIPFSGAPVPIVPTCAAAIIQNASTNPTYQASVASGGNLILPQIKVLDSDGVTEILADYIPETDGFAATCSTSCADATYTNSNGSYSGSVASGGNLNIPNINFTDSDGTTTSVPSVEDIVATPSTPSASVTVSVSNASPSFGDTITVEATTNIAATEYRFYAQGTDYAAFIGTSATNSISWKVLTPHGSISVYAEVSDGTGSTAYTDSPQVINVTGALFDRFDTATTGFSLEQRVYCFFAPLVTIRRSSDNTNRNFGFVNGSLDTAGILAFCGAGDGFVVQWFGQSAERNIGYQSTAASQPKIVSAGAIVTAANGKPAIDFDGVDDFLNILNPVSFVSGFFSFQNDAIATRLVQEIIASGVTFTSQVFAAGTAVTGAGVSTPTTAVQSTIKDTNRHYMSVMTASNDGVYVDGTNVTLGALNTFTGLSLIGNRGGNVFYMDGKIQDIIGFPDDQYANKTAIETYLT